MFPVVTYTIHDATGRKWAVGRCLPYPILSLTDSLLTLDLPPHQCPSSHSNPLDCSSNLRLVWEGASRYVQEVHNVVVRIGEYSYRGGIEQRDPTMQKAQDPEQESHESALSF